MTTLRKYPASIVTKGLALAVALTLLGSMSGCASMFGECLRTEYRTVQTCERREANGHCAHYGMKTQSYCAERAPKNDLY